MFAKCVFPEDSFLEVSLLKSSSFGSLKNSDSEPELESGKSYHSKSCVKLIQCGFGLAETHFVVVFSVCSAPP